MSASRKRVHAALRAMPSATALFIGGLLILLIAGVSGGQEGDWRQIERQFLQMPMEARRLNTPLFWLHGDESPERLQLVIGKLAESHNGGFVAESRPHSDWLGPGWFRDLDVCLEAARKHDLKLWIFDEKWWPSQCLGGKVPEAYRAKRLVTHAASLEGPLGFQQEGYGGATFVAAIAGREIEGGVDPESLIDLNPHVRNGVLSWNVPEGRWKIMRFTWTMAPPTGQAGMYSVDGASQDCVDWFIQTVYQPHYDRYKEDFGKTIVGFFYDEPEVRGDWGTEVSKVLAERKTDYRKALVAWKYKLAGEQQAAARYAYIDAFHEAWGRTMYGGMTRWCEERGVKSIGHFMEHSKLYAQMGGVGPGNMFQMQKYGSMGGIDLVVRQLLMGNRSGPDGEVFQMPKIASSISHAYGKVDDLAMCEIFGAYGQILGYYEMKWLLDQQQVRGVNFMVTHSFNPRAPYDTDCPPYFYNGGYEPRYPLYRVWADYSNRLSLLLSGGHHVCPVALLFCGNSIHVGRAETPEEMATALQDIQFDNDWIPYDVFGEQMRIVGKELHLRNERYKVLIVPPAEVIPYPTLAKAREYFEAGGVVIGYGIMPSRSATLGHGSGDIAALCEAIWGTANPGDSENLAVRKVSAAGGKSFFLPSKPSPASLQQVLVGHAGTHPTLEVMEGDTGGWLHVLHRVKNGRDVFFICNQNHQGEARRFKFRVHAQGQPEYWDAMRNEITAIPFQRNGSGSVEFALTMEPSESALIVFQPSPLDRLPKLDGSAGWAHAPIAVTRGPTPPEKIVPSMPEDQAGKVSLLGASWVWYPEGEPHKHTEPGTRYFRKEVVIPADRRITRAHGVMSADNSFELYINGKKVGAGNEWGRPVEIDVTSHLSAGNHTLAVVATNGVGPVNPAGLIGTFRIAFEEGSPLVIRVDQTWKTSKEQQQGWMNKGFDDSAWVAAKELVKLGQAPWGMAANVTASPIAADPFIGNCTIPADLDPKAYRIYLEMDELPESSAAVLVNGAHADGVIGRPWRVSVSNLLRSGQNTIEIYPLAPKSARLVFYANPLRQKP